MTASKHRCCHFQNYLILRYIIIPNILHTAHYVMAVLIFDAVVLLLDAVLLLYELGVRFTPLPKKFHKYS